ncbi:lipopolysaccharide biosynthesis protein [Yoonia sp. SS1-5]|uniref:GumC family protein n=1 Tax=Yoonia rhodophyticola TaxID=3137370 RepID=A0AAN0NM56_9RHOB
MIADIKFYISLFFRRLHYFLLILILCTATGLVLALTLPPVYRAEARLLVESPQIPDDLAASTVRAGAPELLRVIEQRLLTRANLLDLARRFDVYPPDNDMSADEIVRDMRDRIGIGLPLDGETTGLVFIAFDASTAETSSEVTNDLLTQILQQNVELRTTVSGQTLDFFEQEVTRLDAQLAAQGARILEFKLEHKDALPESLDYRRTRLSALQERVLQIDRELAALSDRRSRLAELFELTGRVDLNEASLPPEERQLRELQEQLASALVIYSATNPRVRSLQAQVAALEDLVAQQREDNSGSRNELLTTYDLQISDIDGQINFLAEQKSLVETEMEQLLVSINATPENAITLGTLERNYENIQTQFDQATEALSEARTGDRIEALSKGQRIVVIEQASPPAGPYKPNRKLIVAAGMAGGMAAGGGLILLLELLNRSIRRPVEITNALGAKPFASLPYLTTGKQRATRMLIILLILTAVGLGVPAAIYYVHIEIMPIDLIIDKLIDMAGL